ncbi:MULTISPECIES: NAD(P)-dependent oxidoreductase [unclassified Mesorhizobium]|uniref:NAD(P)-dependent oxidoreductase n=2 Tax=Mesorhizobium TaxID=68287 RepID=UPI000F7602A4|nr:MULTISPECIES: NAD(P)-dependent oxidoreductase [unclassified Mesorhizobium]AZO02399.1 NAD(P)-dependent oxidoreductase [Mesorhizobium sp. M2A.F.Ca.ET.043.02.1.1]RUW41178.1 NAD(P)-dependent oxidoreductase [Mesorhizobium sp. M2A.F.Ca.ET.015.02.1.1]RUW73952.1 NAD(P)-dependent oxidoreductase [Mesorhizobium sp. M2A.F.Ca.ET.067.02.1.1]RVC92645.1 NAD(P)-dependent oxidoreductase [Mesorhizobium sp. M2A.F.Ca.ET.017.03.2.1]RVD05771.1 NAD(P)-dependent oxidoreductase [Mesorhizobium sp. M2A.F.Ca.ET.029.05.
MATGHFIEGIAGGRLSSEQYADNFSDLHPPLDHHEALVESDRCYFCYDAPCMNACPTSIDIPLFIRQIATGNPLGSAKTIFDQNILGGMCARVCPTETLCEEVCVREVAEGKPVQIGRLQRYATDVAMSEGKQFYKRAEPTGKSIAVVGAGPAGLAAAHRLARHGHEVTILEARPKSGGLNEYGIAAYKSVDDFAQAEVDYVTAIGGIDIQNGKALGRDFQLADLMRNYDAVFLGMGLGGVNALRAEGEDADGVANAVEFIAELRQASDLSSLPVGRRVVVIGGGMTAVDAAVQSKLLGAEEVTICYRRGQEHMNASEFEQDLAAANGVTIRHWLQPKRVIAENGKVSAIELEYTAMSGDKLVGTGERLTLVADQVFKAIGQSFVPAHLNGSAEAIELEGGRIKVDAEGRTSLAKVWAGGDCIFGGDDLTVSAVAQGRDAAESIHRALTSNGRA